MKKQKRIGYWPGRKCAWKPWFAWKPVRLGKIGRVVWLTTINRRLVTCYGCDGMSLTRDYRWEYRAC